MKKNIQLQLLINEKTKKEKKEEATQLKIELIHELIKKELKYIDVFNYYYDIQDLNKT